MKSLIFTSLCAVVLLGSCSSVYRSGQTPDDVYYSPAREPVGNGGYVEANNPRNDGRRYQQEQNYSNYDAYATPDDRWLMMRVRDPYRWSTFDDYNYYSPYSGLGYGGYGAYGGYGGFGSYGYSPFGYSPGFSFGLGSGFYSPITYGIGFGYNNYYNSYMGWNSYYNPYYYSSVIYSPKTNPAGYTTLRSFNPNAYTNRTYNSNRPAPRPYNGRLYGTAPNNSNPRSVGSGRRVLSNNSNSYLNQSQDRPVRAYSPSNNNSYSPSSNSGSSSGGSSRGGGNSGGSGSRPGR